MKKSTRNKALVLGLVGVMTIGGITPMHTGVSVTHLQYSYEKRN